VYAVNYSGTVHSSEAEIKKHWWQVW
jgi:hypothetical protein